MYLMVFRQGQSTFAAVLSSIGGMYEDSLYLSNLYEFLEQDIPKPQVGPLKASSWGRDSLLECVI
jgi:hypothetical protein